MSLERLRLVTASEFRRRMGRRGFLFGAFLLPALILVIIVFAVLTSIGDPLTLPVAFVDAAGVLATPRQLPESEAPRFAPYADEEAAKAAVASGEVAAAFVLEPDYVATRQVTSYSVGGLSDTARSAFRRWLKWNLASSLPDDTAGRVANGIELVTRTLDGRREFSERTWPNVIIPVVAALLFFVIVIANASDAVRAVVDEKESRTMEILITTVSPNELMAGKILAIFLVGATQMLAWAVVAGTGIILARQQIDELSTFQLDWSFVWLVAGTFLPAYVLIIALLASAGAVSSELREGQQLAPLVTLPTMIPAWFMSVLIMNPSGPLAIALTLFPLTAPMTLGIRWAFGTVPLWQIVLSVGLLFATATASVFAAARLFHFGMLRYGRRLTWAEVRQALRPARSA